MYNTLATAWETHMTDFLSASADSVTVHYKPVRSVETIEYDSFFGEGVDSSDPTDIGETVETTPDSVSVSGKTHLDLYGLSVSGQETIQQLGAGSFEGSDSLFTCLLSDVIIADDRTRTVFDEADYVVVEKDELKYEIIGVKRRGMNTAFLVDVFMKSTNK